MYGVKQEGSELPQTPEPSDTEVKPPLCCSYRIVISIVGFFSFFNATLIRIGIVMAMVCMSEPHSRNVTEGPSKDCPDLLSHISTGNREFSWSSQMQGFIKSGAFYGFLIGPFASGFLSFRFGGKIILIIGTFLAGVSYAAIPELTRVSPYFFFGIRIFSGFFGGFIFPATFDILSHWAVPEERQILVGGALIGVPLYSVVNFPLNGFLCTQFGWVWIFYFSTIWMWVFVVCAYFLVSDYPKSSRCMKQKEVEFITPKTPGPVVGLKVPWKKIAQSTPVYAYIITHFCINYGFLTIILHLPVFMQEVHHFHITSNSLLSAAPYVGSLICRILITFTFDNIKKRFHLTTNRLRKTFVIIGVSLPSISLVIVSQISCKYRYLALCCFIVFATTLELSLSGGYLLSLLDLCPSYSNILSGIANAIANTAGLLSAIVTGLVTPNGTQEEWNIVFYISIAFLVFAGIIYVVFGSNELQPWGLTGPVQLRQPHSVDSL